MRIARARSRPSLPPARKRRRQPRCRRRSRRTPAAPCLCLPIASCRGSPTEPVVAVAVCGHVRPGVTPASAAPLGGNRLPRRTAGRRARCHRGRPGDWVRGLGIGAAVADVGDQLPADHRNHLSGDLGHLGVGDQPGAGLGGDMPRESVAARRLGVGCAPTSPWQYGTAICIMMRTYDVMMRRAYDGQYRRPAAGRSQGASRENIPVTWLGAGGRVTRHAPARGGHRRSPRVPAAHSRRRRFAGRCRSARQGSPRRTNGRQCCSLT